MSGEPLASSYSFGDPNAPPPPPTPPPKRTPTSTIFPSPVFETPKQQSQAHFNDSGGWTPRFAEEYSVFNATPGNLRGSPRGTFGDFGTFTPYQHQQPPTSQKRRLSAGGIAEEIAAHATHFSPNPNLPLPPVDPSKRLPSSPGALVLTHEQAEAQARAQPEVQTPVQGTSPQANNSQERSPKKVRRGTVEQDIQGQTITPPPSSTKEGRKPAPKTNTGAMQNNDHGFGDYSGAGQQHPNMTTFVTSSGELFGYPMSAPPSAPLFPDARAFWESDAGSMAGMEIDFSAVAGDAFQTPTSAHHRPSGSLEWARTNQMFQETGMIPEQQAQSQHQPPNLQQDQHQGHHLAEQQVEQHVQQQEQQRDQEKTLPTKRERPLAPKIMMPTLDTAMVEPMLRSGVFQTPVEDPFGIANHSDGVDPGLLFSRPPSSSTQTAVFNPLRTATSPVPLAPREVPTSQAGKSVPTLKSVHDMGTNATQGLGISTAPIRTELRRSSSVSQLGGNKKASKGISTSSPIKPTGRPGLSRSFSENRGKRQVGRLAFSSSSASSSLPALAPAIKPVQRQPQPPQHQHQHQQPGANAGINSSRPSSHSGRSSGRSSPLKAHHHHRLPSLTSIPETASPRTRTSVKFTIDANGRAQVETMVAVEDESVDPSSIRRRRSVQPVSSSRWDSTDEDDESSTDDEPIIIPSRNTSFALPDPLKVTGSKARFHHNTQRSLSEHSTTSSFAVGAGGEMPQDDPESEAETVVDGTPSGIGDAASELEKLRQARQSKDGLKLSKFTSGSAHRRRFVSGNGATNRGMHSPTTLTDDSLPTPSTDSRSYGVRCICDSPEADRVTDGFMVQCEACENWLHGKCINITKRRMMPSVYICAFCAKTPNGRAGRVSASASSPLAHKSFKFR